MTNGANNDGRLAARRLSRRALAAAGEGTARPGYDPAVVSTGVVHFGPGVFFRAHVAWHFDRMLADDPGWGVAAVSMRSGVLAEALAEQDRLYTLLELAEPPRVRVIGALTDYLVAEENPEAVFARLVSPQTRVVTTTVTEKGYCLDASGALDLAHPDIVHDIAATGPPRSVIGWIAEGLKRRLDAGIAAPAVISCDNLSGNGAKLRRAVAAFAAARGYGALAEHVTRDGLFPSTMVDSITPSSDEALRARVEALTGLRDEACVQREPFTQWVVEDAPGPHRDAFERAGAILTGDVSLYEQAKLRLLNGAHSALAYMGLLAGRETTVEAMADPRIGPFVEAMMREEIASTLREEPGFDMQRYAGEILERLRNPAIRHSLRQIAGDGSQKLPYRLLAPAQDLLAAGRPVGRLAAPVAAWIAFVIAETRAGRRLNDPLADELAGVAAGCAGDDSDVARLFAVPAVFPPALAEQPRFADAVTAAYRKLSR